MRAVSLSVACLIACSPVAFPAITGIDSTWTDNFSGLKPIEDEAGTALTAGTGDPGDGTIIQFGVFLGVATTLDPALWTDSEWRSFIPLTGEGSPNTHFDTTMGDGVGAIDGFYDIGVTFDTSPSSGPASSGLPGSSSRVGIRFFDGTSLGSSSEANTVTSFDSGWIMSAPSDTPTLPAGASLDARDADTDDPLIWRNGAASAFSTPEPSTSLLGLLGALILLRRRR